MSSLVNTVKVAVLSVVTFPHGAIKNLFAHTPRDWELPIGPPYPFPQEIIDIIIGHLHNDKVVLATCSLASSSFRRPCQALLYGEITLSKLAQYKKNLVTLLSDYT